MTTEPAAATIYAQVHGRSRAVIESELQRLSRRARGLSERDLSTIESTLDDLAEQLILERMRSLPHRAEQLGELFAVDHPSR